MLQRHATFALVSLAAGCPSPGARSENPPQRIARAATDPPATPRASAASWDSPEAATASMAREFAAAIAAEPIALPTGASLAPRCCVMTGVLGAPIGVSVTLALPMPAPFASEQPATVGVGQSYTLSGTAPHTLLRSPDFAELRRSVPSIAADATRVLAFATERLASLDRARAWRGRSLVMQSSLVGASSNGPQWTVYFTAMRPNNGGPEDAIHVTVDRERGVLDTFAGYSRPERIP